jgi:hypothetical protein
MSNDEMGDPRKYSPHGFVDDGPPKWSFDWWAASEVVGGPARIFQIRRSEWLAFLVIAGSLFGPAFYEDTHRRRERFASDNAVGATANALETIKDYVTPIRSGELLIVGTLLLIYGRLGHFRDSMLGQTQRQ